MVKNFFYAMLFCAVFGFVSCSDDDSNADNQGGSPVLQADSSYIGTFDLYSLDNPDVIAYSQDSTAFSVDTISLDTCAICMKGIKFSSRMPFPLTMTIPGISTEYSSGKYTLAVDSVIATYVTDKSPEPIPYAQKPIKNLSGFVSADSMHLEFLCGSSRIIYSGAYSE